MRMGMANDKIYRLWGVAWLWGPLTVTLCVLRVMRQPLPGVKNTVFDEFLDKLKCATPENLQVGAHEPSNNENMFW